MKKTAKSTIRKRAAAVILLLFMNFNIFGARADTKKLNYLALGDSITSGYGLSDIGASFTEIIANEKNMQLKNIAVDGYTSEDLLNLIALNKHEDDIKNADLITISIGGNDLLKVLFSLIKDVAGLSDNVTFTELQQALLNVDNLIPKIKRILDEPKNIALFEKAIENYYDNVEKIISHIKDINPNVKIMIFNLYNPLSGSPVFNEIVYSAQKIINKMNDRTGSFKNVVLLDAAKAFYNRGLILTNILYLDIHPNKAGNKVLARLVVEKL